MPPVGLPAGLFGFFFGGWGVGLIGAGLDSSLGGSGEGLIDPGSPLGADAFVLLACSLFCSEPPHPQSMAARINEYTFTTH